MSLDNFNERFQAFCRYWGVTPRACAPYRARTQGKDLRGGLCHAQGHRRPAFEHLEALHAHLSHWSGLRRYIRYYSHQRIKLKLNGLIPVQYRLRATNA